MLNRQPDFRPAGRGCEHASFAVLIAAIACLIGASVSFAASTRPDALSTVSERSGFRTTGRYEEVERLCRDFAQAWPDAARCTELGRIPEGRPMLALIASRTGVLAPADAREREGLTDTALEPCTRPRPDHFRCNGSRRHCIR